MKRRLRFYSLAQRDFLGLAAWSQAQWGAKMTRRYLDEIERQISRVVENPMEGSDAELPRPGLRKIIAGRHIIFYMADAHEVQIIRIMGLSQDYWNAAGLT